jgi:tyrosyl-tRNA synthetase
MIKRNMFQERLKKGQEIYLTEFLYPLLQGYDSVAMDVDVEVGGTDQTFNMLVGRKLMRKYRQKEKFVITTPLLENPKTGKKLMSKSEGNYIALDNPADQMYGKIMALPDEVIIPCFKLCTEVSLSTIKKINNPRELKSSLAREIVAMYHSKEAAVKAEKEFEKIFKEKKLPTEMPKIKIKGAKLAILDLLKGAKLVSSKSEAKRLILQGGVKIDGEIQRDWQKVVEIKKGLIIQIGKRRFVKVN